MKMKHTLQLIVLRSLNILHCNQIPAERHICIHMHTICSGKAVGGIMCIFVHLLPIEAPSPQMSFPQLGFQRYFSVLLIKATTGRVCEGTPLAEVETSCSPQLIHYKLCAPSNPGSYICVVFMCIYTQVDIWVDIDRQIQIDMQIQKHTYWIFQIYLDISRW